MPSLTCFLIDDDADDREIFAMAIEDADKSCKCVMAKSGVEAIKHLISNPAFIPDFIFLDLNMPLLSGRECLQELRKIDHISQVPVIIYTTSTNERDIEEVKKLGATHFLTKPFKISTLTKVLVAFFQKQNLPFLVNW